MTDYKVIELSEVKIRDRITVWSLDSDGERGGGSGGFVTALAPELVTDWNGIERRFDLSDYAAGKWEIEIELPTAAEECVNYGTDCRGSVDFHSVKGDGQGAMRCTFHWELRLERYENSMERYADSAVVPDWFDPSYAGERWNEDD